MPGRPFSGTKFYRPKIRVRPVFGKKGRGPARKASLSRTQRHRLVALLRGGVLQKENSMRRRRHGRRRHHTRRSRNPFLTIPKSNPLLMLNRSRHRARRRGRSGRFVRRGHNPVVRLFNALPGAGLLTKAKSAVSMDKVKQGAAITGGILAAWQAPMMLAPSYDVGVKGLGLSLASGALASALVGFAAPSLVVPVALGGIVGTFLKGIFMYGRGLVTGSGATQAGMGQIPPNLIQGMRGMGEFLTTSKPVAAIGPTSALAISGAQRHTNFS